MNVDDPSGRAVPEGALPSDGQGESMPGVLARGTIANLTSQLFVLGTWFALTPFIIRRVGPTEYGMWILATSILGYVTLLDFGVGGAVEKYVAELRARGEITHLRRTIATALRMYLVLGAIAALIGVGIGSVFADVFSIPESESQLAFWLPTLGGLQVAVALPSTTTFAILRGIQRFDLLAGLGIFGTALFAAGVVLSLVLGGGLVWLVASGVITSLITQGAALWLTWRTAPELVPRLSGADRRSVREIASLGSWMFVASVSYQAETQTDDIVVGAFLPVAAVTPYSIARKLAGLPILLTYSFTRLVFPMASDLGGRNDPEALMRLYIGSTRVAYAVYLAIAIPLLVFADTFVDAWIGGSVKAPTDVIVVLLAANLLLAGFWPTVAMLQGTGRHRQVALASAAAAVINIVVSVVLISRIGILGVALGTLIAALASVGFFLPFGMRTFGVGLRVAFTRVFVPALAPAAPAGLALYGLRELVAPASLVTIALVGAVGPVVYGAFYLRFRACAAERATLFSMLLRIRRVLRSAVGSAPTSGA